MDDEDRHVHQLREADCAMRRLALADRGTSRSMIFRRRFAGIGQAIRQPGDDIGIFAMNHSHCALATRQPQHVEDLSVVELQTLVSHIDFEPAIAILHQRRQLLPNTVGDRSVTIRWKA
jgi:hypothetical protein